MARAWQAQGSSPLQKGSWGASFHQLGVSGPEEEEEGEEEGEREEVAQEDLAALNAVFAVELAAGVAAYAARAWRM